jgi:hypothetical protein
MKLVSTLGVVMIAAVCSPLMAATVPVRFVEGVSRGYLLLRDVHGRILAHGDLLQVIRGDEIDKRMVFRFQDGSLYEESVSFTQPGVFRLKTYRLSTRGPAFDVDTEISMTQATGAYRVKTKDRKDGREKILEGKLELPPDVYNGLIMTIVKDLPKGESVTVHFVAFTPDPRLIELELTPVGDQETIVGDLKGSAVHYLIKPKLGMWLRLFATILGRAPSDLHAWVATDEVPAFVGFEGSLTMQGPVWRIEVVSPRLPDVGTASRTGGT